MLDPITGELIRARKVTTVRYEHDHPGSLVHMDVKKLGRIPDGGGWSRESVQRIAGRGRCRPSPNCGGATGCAIRTKASQDRRVAVRVVATMTSSWPDVPTWAKTVRLG